MPARDGALSSVRRASLSAAGSLRRTHCARVLPRSGSGNDIDRAPDAGPVRNRPNAQCVCPCSRVLPAAPGITAPAIARIPTSRRSRRAGPLPAAGQGPRQTCTQLARSRTALGGPITLGDGPRSTHGDLPRRPAHPDSLGASTRFFQTRRRPTAPCAETTRRVTRTSAPSNRPSCPTTARTPKSPSMLDRKSDDLSFVGIAAHAPDRTERRTLRLILYDALASEAMGTLSTGVFLAGYAVALGADNFAIGVLAAVPFLVQLLQIPAVILVERLQVRREICVWAAGIGRAFLLGAATAPLLGPSAGITMLIASLAIYQGMAAIGGCAWNSWMRDLVPATQFGRFFGRRTAATTALSIVLAFLGGAMIDAWKKHVPHAAVAGYSIVFTLSALIGF